MKKIIIIFIVAGIFYPAGAQNFDKLRAAFRTSYTQENSGDYKAAVNTLKSVYDDSSYEMNLRLGWVSFKSGDFKESEAYYRKAITLRPYGIEARFGLVFPLSSMGNWTLVNSIYEEILAIDANNALANYRYGLLAYGKEDYAKADKLFSKVFNLYPFDYDSLIMLAWTRFKLGKSLEARALFQKTLLYSPDDSSALEGLSLIR
ncbi:MAG: tetratricopeptide repeat protein [Bacteroidia bacterium]|nr:tetratricopeptide repeat protein [Bacteroidia bacterium]